MIKWASYILLSFILWVIVEYLTVWKTSINQWISYVPWIEIQYLVIILPFWFVLYVRKWSTLKAFLFMLVVMYFWELLWRNFLLLNFVWFVPASILLVQIWGFLTFVPFWIVEQSVWHNKYATAFFCLWPLTGFAMALAIL